MTLSVDGVRINASRRNRGRTVLILAAEAVLSVFLYMSFAAHLIWPDTSSAATGISPYLSYEGRLSDELGNPLGGTGEPYCFRFSLYDAASGGTKLWPAGTPGTTVSTTTDGVFSALVGQADALTYDFYDSDTVYLNVDVNTATSTNGSTCSGSWETLSPRQQIAASGYARAAENVYSSLLKTNTASNRVDVGAGTGSGAPTLLALDVNNTNQYVGQTCATNGTLWYNSAESRALICENGSIAAVSNATTTIAAIQTNTDTPATAGTIAFADGNGISWGMNGNTITASVDAGGAISQRWKELGIRPVVSNMTNLSNINGQPIFQPFYADGNITVSRLNWEMSRASAGSNLFTVYAGIYSYVNATQISLLGSASASYSNSATASVSALRRFAINDFDVSTLSPGGYVLGMVFTAGNTLSMNYSLRGGLTNQLPRGAVLPGADQYNTASTYNWFPFFGRYSASVGSLPTAVADSEIYGQFSGASAALPWWAAINND